MMIDLHIPNPKRFLVLVCVAGLLFGFVQGFAAGFTELLVSKARLECEAEK